MKKENIKKTAVILSLLFVLLLFMLLLGNENILYVRDDPDDIFGSTLISRLPDYEKRVLTQKQSFISLVRGDNLVTAFDIQAKSAEAGGIKKNFYPKCAATVVISADTSKTDNIPVSWQQLKEINENVTWIFSSNLERQMLLGTLAYGLTGEDMDADRALEFLRELKLEGRFKENDRTAPVKITFDIKAASEKNKNLKLIIPDEGTLTFDLGILTDKEFSYPLKDEEFLNAGLRLSDGRSLDPVYPEKSEYLRAHTVKDAEEFFDVTKNAGAKIKRRVNHTHFYTSADEFETMIMFLAMVIFMLFYMGSVYHRSVRKDIRSLILILGVQVILWIFLTLVKYMCNENSLWERYMWYGYYLFQIGLPLNLLWITLTQEKPGGKINVSPLMKGSFAAGAFLFILVMTNDIHSLVFRLEKENGVWNGSYSYGPGYILIYIFCFAVFFMAVVSLMKKGMEGPNGIKMLLPLLSAFLLVLYTVGYALQWPVAHGSNYAYSFCILSVVFIESALRSGLIPVNTCYRQLFTMSPLAMQLLNTEGETVIAGQKASELPRQLRNRIRGKKNITMPWHENSLLFVRGVRGGQVVWEEDREYLNSLRREMDISSEKLEKANLLLQKEGMIKRKKLSSATRTEIFASMEDEIYERTEELSEKIDDLLNSKNKERDTAYITLLLCYIKRRCNLFFLNREGRDMPSDEMAMYLDELCEFARFSSVSAYFTVEEKESFDINSAALCYDFVFSLLSSSCKTDPASFVGDLKKQEGKVVFRILSSKYPDNLTFTEGFLKNIQDSQGSVTFKELDEETGIYLVLPEEGGKA